MRCALQALSASGKPSRLPPGATGEHTCCCRLPVGHRGRQFTGIGQCRAFLLQRHRNGSFSGQWILPAVKQIQPGQHAHDAVDGKHNGKYLLNGKHLGERDNTACDGHGNRWWRGHRGRLEQWRLHGHLQPRSAERIHAPCHGE